MTAAPFRATDAEYWKSEADRIAADRERLVTALARIASVDWPASGESAGRSTADTARRAYAETVLRESPFIPAVRTSSGNGSIPVVATSDGSATWLECFADAPGAEHGTLICAIEAGTSWAEMSAAVAGHVRVHGCGAPGEGHPPMSMLERIPDMPDPAALGDAATKIARYALAFGRIDRAVCRHLDGAPESDTDHTVGLAWFATALAAACEPGLGPGLVTQFALVHDAVEVFAGDTPTLRITTQERAAKSARERDAATRWQAELGDVLPWLPAMIARYEAQAEPEARFIRAADKIAPKFLHMINGCADLAGHGVTAGELDGILAAQREDIGTYAGEFAALLALYDEMAARVLAALRAAEGVR